jgi:hypothetical protein
MSNSKPLSTVTTGRPGRPAAMHRKAALLIGSAGVEALRQADIYLVPGPLARELALIVEPSASPSETTTLTPANTTIV